MYTYLLCVYIDNSDDISFLDLPDYILIPQYKKKVIIIYYYNNKNNNNI